MNRRGIADVGSRASGSVGPAIRRSATPTPVDRILIALVCVSAMAALLLRQAALPLPPLPRSVAMAVVLAAVGFAALSVPEGDRRARIAPAFVLVSGSLLVTVAAWLSGPVVPVPFDRSALALSLLAAVSEEALFRRALYTSVEPLGAVAAIAVGAVAFAAIHLPLYGVAALPVDLGAGILLGWQRWASGSWLAPAATHAWANVLAVTLR